MNLETLIEEGEKVKASNTKQSSRGGSYISGEEYEKWIAKSIIFLEDNEEEFSSFLIEKFKRASEQAVGNSVRHYNTMIGILKALHETE
ncbi:hypothetical protein [Virgibacillus halodenitrificans]|uniref:hypothetical protein n=1 Tax=Virgibacillus halodenitrificans TaxID=1482 RepID=UPI000EF51E8A|nr:hypothetical protein [Virgibacillus halodenitrificans]